MRTYADACGITRALDVVGDRWAIPVVRELIFGPRRYSDLAAALPGVSTNILGARLKDLTEAGVTVRRRLPPPGAAAVYELTPWGAALEPALIALGHWAAHTPIDLERQTFSASSFALSLKTTFDAGAAAGVNVELLLAMGEDAFQVRIADESLAVRRVVATDAHAERVDVSRAHVQADPKSLAALVYQRLDPVRASRDGVVSLDGSPALVEAFARCFILPEPPPEGSV